MNIKKYLFIALKTVIILFAIYGLVLTVGFFAVRWHISDLPGQVDKNSDKYNFTESRIYSNSHDQASGTVLNLIDIENEIEKLNIAKLNRKLDVCRIDVIKKLNERNGEKILAAYRQTMSSPLLERLVGAIEIRKNDLLLSAELKKCLEDKSGDLDQRENDILTSKTAASTTPDLFVWINTSEWKTITEAIIKDRDLIEAASLKAEIEPRMLVSVLIVEQLRLYYTQRELYETLFEPLKILAYANKMAWGIMAIKEKTAIEIEDHLHDQKSDYYLGKDKEGLLSFSGEDQNKERYERLTNEKNHYYSYLYGALYIKELEAQWQKAGIDISQRPEIIATLFNIGFKNSKPKADPMVGGSKLVIGEDEYTFGSLAFEFYFSGELMNEFEFEKW